MEGGGTVEWRRCDWLMTDSGQGSLQARGQMRLRSVIFFLFSFLFFSRPPVVLGQTFTTGSVGESE